MEISFKDIELTDKEFVDSVLACSDKRFCEYTFGNMFCWGSKYNIKIARTQKGIVLGNPQKARFNFPAGQDAFEIAAALIEQYGDITFTCMNQKEAGWLSDNYAGAVITKQDNFDYIYESEKLASLSGKKLAAKRNHINAFTADGDWHTEPITPQSIGLLTDFNQKWCMGLCDKTSDLYAEMCAVRTGLENFERLGFSGLILYKNSQLCGYSYGERINSDTYCVHVEKADASVRGAYQMINREFVKTYCSDFLYVNREDDAGDEGLKKAKMSYYPTDIGEKYQGEFKK